MNKTSGTKEWAPHSRNRCSGCKNNCRYCYAKGRAIRYKQRTAEDWHEMRLLKTRQSTKNVDGRIMFPTTHDLHIEHSDMWFPFLKEMLENGNEVLIVSKPEYKAILKICHDLYKYVDQIEFRFTIGTKSESVREFWEPSAPSIAERVDALKAAEDLTYRTSVSMEPLLDYFPAEFINQIGPYVTGNIWIGSMNHIDTNDFKTDTEKYFLGRQQTINSHDHMMRVYESLKGNPKIRWKDSIQELLGITQEGDAPPGAEAQR
jgi:DNA repair photolyase